MSKYPISETCPECGQTTFKGVKPETFVAFTEDRICLGCGTRYTPSTPTWAAIVFLIVGTGIVLVALLGIGLELLRPAGGCSGQMTYFICFPILAVGIACVIYGIRTLKNRGDRTALAPGRESMVSSSQSDEALIEAEPVSDSPEEAVGPFQMAPLTHQEKVAYMLRDPALREIPRGRLAPPHFRLLWLLGLKIPPPLFLRADVQLLLMVLLMFIPWLLLVFGVATVLCGWSFILYIAAAAGLLSGYRVAVKVTNDNRSKAVKLKLPPWDRYPLRAPSALRSEDPNPDFTTPGPGLP
jgi:hypothetical protein